MTVSLRVSGTEKVLAVFQKFNEETMKKIENVLRNAALVAVAEAKKNISRPYPEGAVDTGRLRSSLSFERVEREGEIVYRVGTNVEYAPYVEFGTRPHFPPVGNEYHGLMRWVLRHARARRGTSPVFKVSKRRLARLVEARSIAFALAMAISTRGLPPRPYLRPAFILGKEFLLNRLPRVLR